MIIDDVVVLPCVPATPMARRVATIDARASARLNTGTPRSIAVRTSTLVNGTAELMITASRSAPRFSARWGTWHSTPRSRNRSSREFSRTSDPLTVWPISARIAV